MVSSFPIFCFMVQYRTIHFYFTSGKISLEILHIIIGIPETPFHVRKQLQFFGGTCFICQCQLVDFAGIVKRNESKLFGLNTIFFASKYTVPHSVTALITVKLGLRRLPSGIPYRILILDIKISAVRVSRHIVVAITGQTKQFGILIEGIATAGVRNKAEKIFTAQIVDPGKRGTRGCNHVFSSVIIEITKIHCSPPYLKY